MSAEAPTTASAATAGSGVDVRPRRWRWLRRLAVAAVALVGLVVVAVAVLAGSLDRPWLKGRVQRAVRAAAGLDLDYRAIRIRPLSGLWIDGVVVGTPPELRALAPDLARIDHLEARWSLASLLGRGPKIDRVAIDGLVVTVAQTATGRTSLDALAPPAPARPTPPPQAAAAPPAPLSRLLARALASAPPIGEIELSRVAGAWVSARDGARIQRDTLAGLALRVSFRRVNGAWQARIEAGSAAAPLEIDLRRAGPAQGRARLALWARAEAEPAELSLAADVRVRAQDLVPVTATDLFHLEATAHPDPGRGQTRVRLGRLAAADGAVDLAADAILPDAPADAPRLQRAEGSADLTRLLRIAPPGLIPLAADRGTLRFRIAELEARAGAPRLGAAGGVHLETELAGVRLPLSPGAAHLAALRLQIDAQPGPAGGLKGRVALDLRGLALDQPGQAVRADGVALGTQVEVGGDARWTGALHLDVASVDLTGATRLALQKLSIEARARALRVDPRTPLASSGGVDIQTRVGGGELRLPGARVIAENAGFELHAPLSGRAPFAADAAVSADRIRYLGAGGLPLADAPAHLTLRLSDAYPDQARPPMSRGKIRVAADLAALHATLNAEKRREAIDFDLALDAASLALARPWLPPDLRRRLDLAGTTLALETHGHAERLASTSPLLRQTTTLRVERTAFDRTAARSLTLGVRSNGDLWRHDLDLDLGVGGLTVDGRALGDEDLAVGLTVDRKRPSADLHLQAKGAAAAELTASAAFDERARQASCDLRARVDRPDALRNLAGIVPLLGELDLSRSILSVDAHGALTGVVDGIDRAGGLRLAPDPLRTAAGEADFTLGLAGLRLRGTSRRIALGAGSVKVRFKGHGPRRELEAQVLLDDLAAASNDQKIGLGHLDETLALSLTGDPMTGPAELTDHLALHHLEQSAAPFVPTDDVILAVAANRDRAGIVHLSRLTLDDPGAGTRLALSGGLDLGDERRRVSLQAQLDQDLGKLRGLPGAIDGGGHVGLEVKVESPDTEVFHARAGLALDDVHVRMPAAGLAVESVDARIPISLDLVHGAHGLTLPHEETVNPYAALRFADQQPLLNRSNFLSIGRLVTPFVTVAPLAGNLEIDQNIVSLGQLEMGVRGGHVTGECALDWNGWGSKVEAHVRASGVQSSHGEPFDGDAALVISARDRGIDGRAQILRIGRRHLLDLLDLADPHRVDPAMNRIRHALAFGYPDQVRIAFDHGFASARVTLGGLARLIRIDEIRGIPTGSLLDKILASSSTSEPAP